MKKWLKVRKNARNAGGNFSHQKATIHPKTSIILAILQELMQKYNFAVELLDISSYGIVVVKLSGGKLTNSLQRLTTILIIEEVLKRKIPEIACVVEG